MDALVEVALKRVGNEIDLIDKIYNRKQEQIAKAIKAVDALKSALKTL